MGGKRHEITKNNTKIEMYIKLKTYINNEIVYKSF